MATAVMDEVLRQRDATLAAAGAAVRAGHPELALRTLGERVRETGRDTLGEAAGRIWLALPEAARADTAVLAPTHAMREEIHAAIREGLALEGVLHGRTLTLERLIARRHMTRAAAADLASYAEGDTVVFHRDAYGCRRDDVCTVARVGDGEVELAHPDGTPRRFRPSGNVSRYLGVFDTAVIDIRAGERIRWTRNRPAPRARFGRPRAPDLVNGDTAEVLDIDARRVRLRTRARRATSRWRAPTRSFATSTMPTARRCTQPRGRTHRSVIAVLGSAALTDQTLLYVEMSRAAEEFVLLTDDREALAEMLVHRPGLEEGALEAIGEALTSPPAVEPEVFETLRADWAAVRARAERAGDLAYFTEGYTEVMARAAALDAIEDLPADMRRFTAALLAEHKRHRERERTVTGLIRRMQAHGRRWAELGWAHPDPAEKPPPAHLRWRAEANRMLDTARTWHTAGGAIARHLDAMPGVRAGFEAAVHDLHRTCRRDDFRYFERLWHSLRTHEGESMVYLARYDEVTALAEALAGSDALTPAQHAVVGEWRSAHDRAMAHRAEVERFAEEAAALVEARHGLAEFQGSDAVDDPDDPASPVRRAWRNDTGASLARARARVGASPRGGGPRRRAARRCVRRLRVARPRGRAQCRSRRHHRLLRPALRRARGVGRIAPQDPGRPPRRDPPAPCRVARRPRHLHSAPRRDSGAPRARRTHRGDKRPPRRHIARPSPS